MSKIYVSTFAKLYVTSMLKSEFSAVCEPNFQIQDSEVNFNTGTTRTLKVISKKKQ